MPKQSVFVKYKGRDIPKSGQYIQPGEYWLQINRTYLGENRKKEPNAVIEGTVVACLSEDCTHRVGETAAKITKQGSDYFLADLSDFVCAALDMNRGSVVDDEMIEALSSVFETEDGNGPFANQIMHVLAYNKTTQKGGDFTTVKWKGLVGPATALKTLDEATILRFWPNGELHKLAEAMSALTA